MDTCLSRRWPRGLMGEHNTGEGASATHVALLAHFETVSLSLAPGNKPEDGMPIQHTSAWISFQLEGNGLSDRPC